MPAPVGKTGADGIVVAPDVGAGELRVSARHPAYGQVSGTVTVPGNDIVLTMQAPGELVGVVIERGARPQPGKWMVVLEAFSGRGAMPSMPRLAAADSEGAFRIRVLQPGQYRVRVEESLSKLRSLGAVALSLTKPRVIHMQDRETVTITAGEASRVQLEVAGEPKLPTGPSVRVTGSVTIDGRPGSSMVLSGWGNAQRLSAMVDAAGRFDLGQVAVGTAHLELEDPESDPLSMHTTWARTVQIEPDKDVVLDIEINTGAVSGLVLDADGASAVGTTATLASVGGDSQRRFRAVTDEAGRFALRRVPEARYTVHVEDGPDGARGSAVVDVQAGVAASEVVVRLRATVAAAGRLDMAVFGNTPPVRVWVSLAPVDGSGAHNSGWVVAASDGGFRIVGLLPGEYKIQAFANWEAQPGKMYTHGEAVRIGTTGVQGLFLQLELQK